MQILHLNDGDKIGGGFIGSTAVSEVRFVNGDTLCKTAVIDSTALGGTTAVTEG